MFYLAFLLLGLAVASCKDDGGENPEPGWTPAPPTDPKGWLFDGGSIRDMEFTCPPMHLPAYKGGGIVKLTDYSKLSLEVEIGNYGGISTYAPDDIREWGAYSDFMRECFMERSAVIVKAYDDYGYEAMWPHLFTAYTYDDVSLTCDRTLFGQEPGTDLSGFFSAMNHNPCVPVGVEDPAFVYNYGEDIPADMRSAFPVNVWLAPEYTLLMNTCPEEKYDKLTFRLAMPIRKEHTRDYIVSKYRGTGKPLESTDHLFEKECDAYFDWN